MILNKLIQIRNAYQAESRRFYTLKTKQAKNRSRDKLQALRMEFYDASDATGIFEEGKTITLRNAVFSVTFGGGVGGITGTYKIIGSYGTKIVLDADGEAVDVELLERPMGHDQLSSIVIA